MFVVCCEELAGSYLVVAPERADPEGGDGGGEVGIGDFGERGEESGIDKKLVEQQRQQNCCTDGK